jgi:small subunit ribosomal protein S3
MGQKVHPYVLRLGFGKNWYSRWFSNRKREYSNFLEEDLKIREIIRSSYPLGSISEVIVERVSQTLIKVKIRTSRPGVIIGRRGQDIEKIKKEISKIAKKEVAIDVLEVADPALDAQLVADQIAFQIVRRVNFRRAMKKSMQQANSAGCEGMKVRCSGRLGGAEIARRETYKYGKVPLQTFRADIDFAYATAKTTYGAIGVKVWIYKGVKNLGAYLLKDLETPSQKPQPNIQQVEK